MLAAVTMTLLAGRTRSVEDSRAHDGTLARTKVRYTVANFFNDATKFMTH